MGREPKTYELIAESDDELEELIAFTKAADLDCLLVVVYASERLPSRRRGHLSAA